MRTVLFLTTVWPGARRSGGESVSQTLIDAMRAAGYRVIVIAYRRPGEQMAPQPDDVIASARPIETQAAGWHVATWLARAGYAGMPYSVAKYVSSEYRRRVEECLAGGVDLVIVDHAGSGWALPPNTSLPFVYLAHNVEHELYAEHAARHVGLRRQVYAREARRIRTVEASLLSQARLAWALSEADANAARALVPSVDVRVLSLPPGVQRATTTAETDVVLLGSWSWAANAVGLEWFLDRVCPQLPPGTRVRVAGAGAERYRRAIADVRFDGIVHDATRFLAGGRVIAVPARAGAGVQVKTLDAIATGRPVVATSLALRGLDSLPPTVRVADEPIAFAERLAEAVSSEPSVSDPEAVDAWVDHRRQRFEHDVREALDDVLAAATR